MYMYNNVRVVILEGTGSSNDRIMHVSKEPRSFEFLMQRVSVAIQRGNAPCILGTMPNASDLADMFYL